MIFSYDEYYRQRLKDFVAFGELREGEIETHVLVSSKSTEINDGPKEEPLGIRLKLPPFKGWSKELQ